MTAVTKETNLDGLGEYPAVLINTVHSYKVKAPQFNVYRIPLGFFSAKYDYFEVTSRDMATHQGIFKSTNCIVFEVFGNCQWNPDNSHDILFTLLVFHSKLAIILIQATANCKPPFPCSKSQTSSRPWCMAGQSTIYIWKCPSHSWKRSFSVNRCSIAVDT